MSHPLTQQSLAWSHKIAGLSKHHKQGQCRRRGVLETLLGKGASVAISLRQRAFTN